MGCEGQSAAGNGCERGQDSKPALMLNSAANTYPVFATRVREPDPVPCVSFHAATFARDFYPITRETAMPYKFSARSLSRMNGVHPDLVAVMKLAIERSPIDFTVLEGLRTLDRQKKLVASGASKTLNSRHLTGHALDVAPLIGGKVSWDWPAYHRLAPVIKAAAAELGVEIEWGGDWVSFKDGPHWQLPWRVYDGDDMRPRAFTNAPDSERTTAKPGLLSALLALLRIWS